MIRFGFIDDAFLTVLENRRLIFQLARRDIAMRYRSSVLGPVWLAAQPLLLLLLYSFVFQVVFRSRWGSEGLGSTDAPFGLILFVGLVLHNILSDTLVRSPDAITSNQSLVKCVVFPVEILPVVNVASALLIAAMSFAVLGLAMIVFIGHLPGISIACVLPVLGLAMFATGVGWVLSSLGVYLRDLSQMAPLISTLLMFTAPIAYPATMVPEPYRPLLLFNPLTVPVDWCRQILFRGQAIYLPGFIYLAVAAIVYVVGYGFFRVLRREFADVI